MYLKSKSANEKLKEANRNLIVKYKKKYLFIINSLILHCTINF